MRLTERFKQNQPLEQMELALVRAAQHNPLLLTPGDEAVLRTSLALARMHKVRQDGRDVRVGAFLDPFREHVQRRLGPVLLGRRKAAREDLVPLARDLKERTIRTRDELVRRFSNRLSPEAIDRELRHKSLVLVMGGGGGTGHVYVGVLSMLEEYGLRPALLAGASMGAVHSLFRSRAARFDQTEVVSIVRGLSWRRLFRVISSESRYGLPAALRLYLRASIGRYFHAAPELHEPGMRLADLPIPTIVSVSGIRRGMLPRPVEFYARVLNVSPRTLMQPAAVATRLQATIAALGELVTQPEIMVKLHLGADDSTRQFDALDAVGFSSALPGVIHYDVLREDQRMRGLLDELLEARGIFRLVDGGLVDNLPVKAAWRAVQRGLIGTRNVLMVGLNGFAPRISAPLWLPLSRLAELTVAPNRPYAHVLKDFKQTLSPLELVPSVELLAKAVELGRSQIAPELPLLTRMLAPLPRL